MCQRLERLIVNSMEWNVNIGLVPLHKSIEWKVRQSEMDKCHDKCTVLHTFSDFGTETIESITFAIERTKTRNRKPLF